MKKLEDEISEKVRKVVGLLCCHPENLEVFVEQQAVGLGYSVSVRIRPHRGDVSRVIGENGKVFRALREAVERLGRGSETPVTLGKVLEGVVGERDDFVQRESWPAGIKKLEAALQTLAGMLFADGGLTGFVDAPRTIDGDMTIVKFRAVPERGFPGAVNALVVLSEAMGRMFGRTVRATVEPIDAQPKTADGRHVREVRR